MPKAIKKRKVTKKLAEKLPALIPQPHGGALLASGIVGHVGAGGRPPNWLRDKCDELLAAKESLAQVEEILNDKAHPMFATMWKAVADRAAGKPKEIVESNSAITVKVVYSHE